ncbi:unnamed protein product, partial [Bubo scandiacus]
HHSEISIYRTLLSQVIFLFHFLMKDYIDACIVNNCSAFPILAQGQSDMQYFAESANMTRDSNYTKQIQREISPSQPFEAH